jgi:hypothetical protein
VGKEDIEAVAEADEPGPIRFASRRYQLRDDALDDVPAIFSDGVTEAMRGEEEFGGGAVHRGAAGAPWVGGERDGHSDSGERAAVQRGEIVG